MFEINNDGTKNICRKVDEKGRLRCPMCRGRGYFEPTERKVSRAGNDYFTTEDTEEKNATFQLPVLENKIFGRVCLKQQKKVLLPSIRKSNSVLDKSTSRNDLHSKLNPLCRESNVRPLGSAERNQSVIKPETSFSNGSEVGNTLLPSPETPKNPQDALKTSLIKLKGSDWNGSLAALRDILQISRYQPSLLEGSMVVVYRSLISLLKSFRSQVTRTACQALNEFFSNVPYTQRPEFDELVGALLQKTADTNKFVRIDANEALDSMVINILPIHSVRTLVQKGIPHRNSVVRTAAARLLVCIVGTVGVQTLFAGNKETRNRIVSAAAQCMNDGCQDVRNYGCRIMKMFIEHEDFEEVLHGCVNNILLNRIEKSLITLKYQKHV